MNPASSRRCSRRRSSRFAAARSAQKTQLIVYTALETDQIKAYQEGFNKVEPNIEIKWVRDSTGVITAKLLAEKANPQADVVMGRRRVEPGAVRHARACSSRTRRSASTRSWPRTATRRIRRRWWGMDVYGATICFNTVEAQKQQHARSPRPGRT